MTLYAKGLSTREIVDAFKEMYDADVSATLVSKVTERVLEQITSWQARPLDAIYPIVYLDCIVIKIRENQTVINKAIYLALGVNVEGHKDLLGLWISQNEGAKFWLSVLTELKARGVHCSHDSRKLEICVLEGLQEGHRRFERNLSGNNRSSGLKSIRGLWGEMGRAVFADIKILDKQLGKFKNDI